MRYAYFLTLPQVWVTCDEYDDDDAKFHLQKFENCCFEVSFNADANILLFITSKLVEMLQVEGD